MRMGENEFMTETITIGESGEIKLPEAAKRVFGARPGDRLRAEVTADRIELVKDVPEISQGVIEKGVLVMPRVNLQMDAGAAVRADREDRANRTAGR